jgi:hypothetical protein
MQNRKFTNHHLQQIVDNASLDQLQDIVLSEIVNFYEGVYLLRNIHINMNIVYRRYTDILEDTAVLTEIFTSVIWNRQNKS